MRSEVNITPLIDVLLVLLISFMLMVRLIIPLNIADERGGTGDSNVIVLELPAAGGYRLNQQPVEAAALGSVLREAFELRSDKVLFVKAAPNRTYAEAIAASDLARGAGVEVIALAP
jgi:biopolymer transport protein ExbD